MLALLTLSTPALDAGRGPLFAASQDGPSLSPAPPPNVLSPAPPSPPVKHKPLAVAISGGGFRSMFNSIGLARAFARTGGWTRATHLAGNSGGTWFNTYLQYSSGFWADVNSDKAIEDIVNAIAEKIMEQYAIQRDELVIVPDIAWVPSEAGRSRAAVAALKTACAATVGSAKLIIGAAADALDVDLDDLFIDFPWGDWRALVEDVFMAGVTPPATGDIMTPSALAHVTYVVSAGMVVDTWLDMDRVACLMPQTTDSTSLGWLEENGASKIEWPAAFVRGGDGGSSGWRYGDAIESWQTAIIEAGDSCAKAKKLAGSAMVLPTPTAEFAAAWSGGATGYTSSPTELKGYMINMAGSTTANTVMPCFPGTSDTGIGAESMGPPVMDGNGDAIWRGNDGGSTDNLGLSHLIGRMQDDCRSPDSKLDCAKGLNIIVWDHDPGTFSANGSALRWTFVNPGAGLPADPPGTLRNLYVEDGRATMQPSAAVFDGEYPTTGWQYGWLKSMPKTGVKGGVKGEQNAEVGFVPSKSNSAPSGMEEDQQLSEYWQGALTTIENKWFGVRAGTKIHALFLRPKISQATIVAANSTVSYTHAKYAISAAAMATDAEPIFHDFLAAL